MSSRKQITVCSFRNLMLCDFSLHDPGLWAVVNNAGVSTFGEVEFTSMDTYKQVSEINLWGVIRVTKAVLPLIRKAKGKSLLNKVTGCRLALDLEHISKALSFCLQAVL